MRWRGSPRNEEAPKRPQTYRVELSDEDPARLLLLVGQGSAPARVVRRAHTLLHASEGAALHVDRSTVQRPRERFCRGGLNASLYESLRQVQVGAPSSRSIR
jgi:hypothetical protein